MYTYVISAHCYACRLYNVKNVEVTVLQLILSTRIERIGTERSLQTDLSICFTFANSLEPRETEKLGVSPGSRQVAFVVMFYVTV